MHILITGGTGFIGQAFINTFQGEHSFTVFSRDLDKANRLFKHIPADQIKFISQLSKLEPGDHVDAVINLAGEPIMDKLWSANQKHKLEASRWETTQQLVDLINAQQISPKVLISGSAVGVYGRQGDKIVDETHAISYPEYSTELCQHWEQIAHTASEHTRVVLIRTGIVLGKNGGALKKIQIPFKYGFGGRIGNGQQYMSWIHIDDMVAAINFILMRDTLNGPFNMTAPNPVKNKEFTQAMAARFNKKAWLHSPSLLLRLVLGERAELIIYGQRVVPSRLIEAGFEYKFESVEDALAAIYPPE
ncbi:MAG: hypothetical protein ACI808_002475 [Paraglaciecola sp.]|jgi:uncharacterized protein (TIGR01777 family)